MRSLRGNFSGSESILYLEEASCDDLDADAILVKVKACAIDIFAERKYFKSLFPNGTEFPLGHEVCGEVIKVGSNVELFKEGSQIAGILPYDSKYSGCSEQCVLNQYDCVEKPQSLSHILAASVIGAGLSAYTAVHYLAHVTAGDTVLVLDGASQFGSLSIQMASLWGAKVISTYRTQAEKQFLEDLRPPIAQVVGLEERTNILASSVMEETGKVGVDCVIDNGVRMFTSEEDKDLMGERIKTSLPHKHEIISCLGFAGKWITGQPDLQLDPPDSHQLFLRCASVGFLFPPAWTLMRAQHGRFQHILNEVMEKAVHEKFRSTEITIVPLSEASEILSPKSTNTLINKTFIVVP